MCIRDSFPDLVNRLRELALGIILVDPHVGRGDELESILGSDEPGGSNRG